MNDWWYTTAMSSTLGGYVQSYEDAEDYVTRFKTKTNDLQMDE